MIMNAATLDVSKPSEGMLQLIDTPHRVKTDH